MSLDDRLRRAHQNQLDDVRQRVDLERSHTTVTAGRTSAPGGFLLAAAAVVVLLSGVGLLVRNAVASNPTVEVEAGTDPATDDAADAAAATTVPAADPTVPEGDPTVPGAEGDEVGDAGQAPDDADDADDDEASGDGEIADGADGVDPADNTPAVLTLGVANDVCPSGLRAELESAALRYVGENQGWGRLFDLVDEQDGPHYYQAWEPGYPDPVTVELTLAAPVMATEIRLAQDPFTPVDGDIIIEAAGQQIAVTLEGTEGWKQHVFAEPTRLDRFTIRRESATSNIMEVLVCVAPPG